MGQTMYHGSVRTAGQSMAKSVTDVHAFKIFMDEPPELGGDNGAPSPLDFILAAHGGCLNYMTYFIANELNIPVESTDITVSAALDPGKFAGTDHAVRAGYQAVEVNISINSPASDDEIEKLRQEVESRCPVSDNIAHATPVRIAMQRAS